MDLDFLSLNQALRVGRAVAARPDRTVSLFFVSGFTPLYLPDFIAAYLRLDAPNTVVNWSLGRYGDFFDNLTNAVALSTTTPVIVMDWADLDPRLSARNSARLSGAVLGEIVAGVAESIQRFSDLLSPPGCAQRIVAALPTGPLLPFSHTGPWQDSPWEAELRYEVEAGRAAALAKGARLVNPGFLDEHSPLTTRRDLSLELSAGFPFSRHHASVLAFALTRLLNSPSPRKGLVIDLDNTLWQGILGEEGVNGVRWHQEDGAQHHGMFQRFLGLLRDEGVLLAVTSKNDPVLVREALARSDLQVDHAAFQPVLAGWQPKSSYIARILAQWNIAPDAVVFVDDSPFELAEVMSAFPGLLGIQFPASPTELQHLLEQLRSLFARPALSADDSLRASSLAASQVLEQSLAGTTDPEAFLGTLEGVVEIISLPHSNTARSLELVNKTNQFNLNGIRLSEPEWYALCSDPNAFVHQATYRDRLGQLGTVAVLFGRVVDDEMVVEGFVLSCRAFSRRVEHHLVNGLFEISSQTTLRFFHQATPRNTLVAEFFQSVGAISAADGYQLHRDQFATRFRKIHDVRYVLEGDRR